MKVLVKIAWRNILRHRSRTMRSAVTVAVTLTVYIFLDSLFAGMDRIGTDNTINLTTAGVKVHSLRYQEKKHAFPLDYEVGELDSFVELLGNDEVVKGITPRTQFFAKLSNYSEALPVIGTVIEPITDSTVFSFHNYVEGENFSQESEREIMLGSALAKDLGVEVGEYITLYAMTKYESRNADEFRVVGVINTSDPTVNSTSVTITFKAANDFLDLEGLATEMNIGLHHRANLDRLIEDADHVRKRIANNMDEVVPLTFDQIGAAFFELSKQKRAYSSIFMGVILLIAAVGIFNTVLMSVYERTREIGVLRAHGMCPSEVTLLFCLEGFFTGVVGCLMGVVCGVIANVFLTVYGFPFELFFGGTIGVAANMPFWGTIYGEWNLFSFLFSAIFAIVIATIAGIYPSVKGGRFSITEALRHV
ncbi:FtsX-like permease family protein [Chitinispirillales bacterium ANBcel5]|uniref:ABC transporter permease n=1 Tax=Cellulosispirillum alkaliphilum TaxID=3039283 RepID=UPI002A531B87|nr:FtsX-like permease family protein [Chitinispirillales bacterium ANBcel5]